MRRMEFDNLRQMDGKIREKFNSLPEEKKKKSLNAKTFVLYPFEVTEQLKKSFEDKEQDSLDMIVNHLKTFKKSYVATSFGMDSIVMMDLVIRASKIANVPIPDMFINNTLNLFKEEKKYWDEMVKFFGIEKQFKIFTPPKDENGVQQTVWSIAKKVGHLPSFRAMGGRGEAYKRMGGKESIKKIGSRGDTPECCDILKKETMKKFLKSLSEDERYDCHFVGTRAEESRMRRLNLLQRCRTYLLKTKFPYPIRVCTPLGFWTSADIYEYYARYNIPKNPAYKIHNMTRMGCASCPAHKNWEIRLAKDPTLEGLGMLKMNLKIEKETEPNRFKNSIEILQKWIKTKESYELITEIQRDKILDIINEFTNEKTICKYFTATQLSEGCAKE